MARSDEAALPPKPSPSLAKRGINFLACQLRLFSVLQMAAGAGYIAMAVFLQFPPGDPLTLGLWAIGCLAILTAIFGFVGGCCRARCCLGVYTVLAVLATLGQAAFVLYLFIDPAHAENEVAKYQSTREGGIKDNLHSIIINGRWVLLGLLGAQVVAILVAALLRCCTKHRSYEEFQEEEDAEYEARRAAAADHMEQLKSKLGLAGAAGEAGGSKRAISITATSGSAAERAQQAAGMRSVLFQRSSQQATEDGKLEAEMEAGKISSRVATDAETSNPWDAQASPATAWPQATTPPPQGRFKPSWSKASSRQQ